MQSPRSLSLPGQVLLFLVCCAGDYLAHGLALPPAGIEALDPVAGIALACMLRWGGACAPAIGLAQFLVRWHAGSPAAAGAMAAASPLAWALTSVLQAGCGAWLVRRRLGSEPTLYEPRDIVLFMLLGGFVASLAGLALGTLLGWFGHPWSPEGAFTGWLGRSLSVGAVAPLALSVVGLPVSDWRGRRVSVAVPLLIGLLFLGAMMAVVLRADERRIAASFERESNNALSILSLELLEPQRALEAMRSIFTASDAISREGMRLAALPWLQGPGHLQSLGYETKVALPDIPAFEAKVRADGVPGFSVFDRNEENTTRSAPTGTVYAITYMEPAARSVSRLGLNSYSIAAARQAIETTARTGQPVATRRFRLTQDPKADAQSGIVTYQAVYAGEPKTDAERLAAVRGVVLTTVRLDETLGAVLGRLPKSISVCIVDATPGSIRERLAGAPGCESERLPLSRVEPVAYAGRHWELHMNARDFDLPGARGGNATPFGIAGILALALLAMLLLTVTGRTRRIELAIDDARKARATADTANNAKRDFLANMSHEIRTPMNAILGMSHLALRSGLAPRQHDYVQKIERSAQSLLGVINDILDFSKVEAGKLTIEAVPFHLGDVLEHLANLVGLGAEDKGLELVFSVAPGLPTGLVGDPLRLTQVLVNLGTNAVKFTQQGEVVIGVSPQGREMRGGKQVARLRFSVRDTGIGIAEADRERLFQAFEQAENSTSRRYGGTGLGLAISHQLVSLMGGELSVASTLGQGSEFAFELTFELHGEGVQMPASAPSTGVGGRVLVVDDNATARKILVAMAQGLGFSADQADGGGAALRAVQAAHEAGRPYEVLLIDWKMPGMDGVDCARSLGTLFADRGPPVLMTTGFGRDDLQHRLLLERVEVSDILTKPVLPSSLFDACSSALGRAIHRPPSRSAHRTATLADQRARLRGARVLLVEDNDINAALATELLEDAGLHVVWVVDGQQALDALALDKFDAVLMDCQMPLMDGYAATRAIRARPGLHDGPIIAMTANALQGDREKALEAGMNDHISKPIDVPAMFATLARWIAPEARRAVARVSGQP